MFLFAACSAPPPTWTEDVRPIVHARCASCHVEGGSGPMPLDTWTPAAEHAQASLAAMEAGTMPPWPPDPGCASYEDERRLAAGELEVFRAWVEAGTPFGEGEDPGMAAPTATLDATDTAAVGPYTPDTAAGDDYRCFVLPELDSDVPRYLHASQVVPGTAQVHHVLVYALPPDQRAAAEDADLAEEGLGYTCFGGPLPAAAGGDPTAGFGDGFPTQLAGWVPGNTAATLPDDVSVRIEAGHFLVMQVHYSAVGGEPVPDTTTLQLQLGTEPTSLLSATHPVAILDLAIPAGASEATFTRSFPYYGDPLTVRTIMAHMHLLGERQRTRILEADGGETCLLDVPDWDFHWQQTYVLAEAATLGDGDAIELLCTYDNSAENQPEVDGVKQAPRDVTWGEGTLDEMCLAYFSSVAPYTPPEDPEAAECAGVDACLEGGATLDALLTCPAADLDCATCTLRGTLTCGAASCTQAFTDAQGCLATCGMSAVMLGSNLGACLAAECPESYDALQACVDPVLASGSCDEMLATCGAS